MKKRTMLIGPKNSGKTTIAEFFEDSGSIKKMANVVYTKKCIDVPGVYLESPWMHNHIIALQQSARQILLLLPLAATRKIYPPGFAKVFRVPLTGVITYNTAEITEAELLKAQERLREIGVKAPFLEVNIQKAQDLEQLRKIIEF